MTLSIDGTDVGAIVGIAATVFTFLLMIVIGWFVYLMVRPPRHVREQRRAERRGEIRTEMDPFEAEELARIVERMESRLEVLERALADQIERPALRGREPQRNLAPAEDSRESGRKE